MDDQNTIGPRKRRSLIFKLLVRFSFLPVLLGLIVLLPAGTLDFWQVYLYLGVLVVPMTLVLFYFMRRDPAFLARRTHTREREKGQLLISYFSMVVFVSGYMISGLDHRFGWSEVPLFVVLSADLIILLGYTLIFLVFRQNSYASNIVEVSEGQQVISTGLYRWVRHPMYSGVLIMFLPTPLALGSCWGLIPFAFLPFVLVMRLLQEEKLLRKELKGYDAYCRKTRYRLIPFLW